MLYLLHININFGNTGAGGPADCKWTAFSLAQYVQYSNDFCLFFFLSPSFPFSRPHLLNFEANPARDRTEEDSGAAGSFPGDQPH
jgi:hypothetical protein